MYYLHEFMDMSSLLRTILRTLLNHKRDPKGYVCCYGFRNPGLGVPLQSRVIGEKLKGVQRS